jgi:hypothetical protein
MISTVMEALFQLLEYCICTRDRLQIVHGMQTQYSRVFLGFNVGATLGYCRPPTHIPIHRLYMYRRISAYLRLLSVFYEALIGPVYVCRYACQGREGDDGHGQPEDPLTEFLQVLQHSGTDE